MSDPAVPGFGGRKDVVWREGAAVANYLNASRQAIPLANEQLDAMIRAIAAFGCPTRTILDLGAGDGAVASVIAQQFPVERITLVDFSLPMLQQAVNRFAGSTPHVDIIDSDLLDPRWRNDLPGEISTYDVVVSRYAIHHLPDDRKKGLYEEVHDLVAPGGMFFNIEHVSSVSPVYQGIFESMIIEGMVATSDASLDLEQATAVFRARQDADTNILAPAEEQCSWLRDIGFVDVDVIMKVFELAVIAARRPDA